MQLKVLGFRFGSFRLGCVAELGTPSPEKRKLSNSTEDEVSPMGPPSPTRAFPPVGRRDVR